MKVNSTSARRLRRSHPRQLAGHSILPDDRSGSVLLVVIGMLGMLLLAGIAFYTFASQENSSAEEYADAAKEQRAPSMQADALFNFGLEQLILGPEDTMLNSALRGGRGTGAGQLPWGRHSILAGLLGNDTTVYNGFGIRLQSDVSGSPFVDQDNDGTADNMTLLSILNFSASANNGTTPGVPTAPAVDTGVTSPDINSLYLSYTGTGINPLAPGGNPDIAVHIPSFHRPQYRLGTGWHTSAATARRIFRPHPDHKVANNPGLPRFLSTPTVSPTTGQLVAAFPFSPAGLSQGVWDLTAPVNGPAPQFQYDADNDGDGTNEGIWMDLDHPVQELADGRKFVPLYSFTVRDADGLINLNVSGNRSGANLQVGPPFTLANGGHMSRSNFGVSRSEINPQWGMLADPTVHASVQTSFDEEYRVFWGLNSATHPANTISRIEMSNMDFFHLLHGRAKFLRHPSSPLMTPNYRVDGDDHQPQSYFFGKWELKNSAGAALSANMVQATSPGVDFATRIPQPGQEGADDDGDIRAGRAFFDQFGLFHPSMRHPFDPIGNGIGHQTGGTGIQAYRGSNGNATWLAYESYQNLSEDLNNNGTLDTEDTVTLNGKLDGVEDLNRNGVLDAGEDADGDGQLDWGEDANHNYLLDVEDTNGNGTIDAYPLLAFPNYLAAPAMSIPARPLFWNPVSGLVDEADESVADPALITANAAMSADSMFGPEEEFGLLGSNQDLITTGFTSRLRNLAPANFRDAPNAAAIRSQYNVSSMDRIQYTPGNNLLRSGWEINADTDNDNLFEFPPAVFPPAANSPLEPIRTPVRFAIMAEFNGFSPAPFVSQLRLNMNLFATSFNSAGPVYRPLTPHPVDPGNTPIPLLTAIMGPDGVPGRAGDDDGNGIADFIDNDGNGTYTPGVDFLDLNELGSGRSDDILPTASLAAQEFWARRDRQQMARDIYVLLYLLGGGNDATVYTGDNSARAIYTNAQMEEMAQFAVNYVDALDRDDIITKFEYDRNLGNGWNLGDNPYDTGDDAIIPADRHVVYGVEAQQLTFSEVLGIISRRVMAGATYVDHVATQVNDSEGPSDRYYTYMELRNASPFAVDLTSGAWQIAVQDDPDGTPNSGDEQDRTQLTLLSGSVGSGSLFTIGSRGGPPALDPNDASKNLPSKFKVDTTGAASPTFNTSTSTISPASDFLDLDLIPTMAGAGHDQTKSLVTDGSGGIPGAGITVTTAGNFLYGGTTGNVTVAQETEAHIFVLRRRANPHRTSPVTYSTNSADHIAQSNDNPWIEVDRMVMPNWNSFQLLTSDMTATAIQDKLTPITSFERTQPFTRLSQEADHVAGNAGTGYRGNTVGQDNSGTVMPLTLFQTHLDREFASATDLLAIPMYGPGQVTNRVGRNVLFNDSAATAMLSQERFLRPQHFANTPAGGALGNVNLNNRWYRLLELLEVPSRTHSSITSRDAPYNLRTPGRINLNTIRNRSVLAGLLDDWQLAFDAGTGLTSTTLTGHMNGNFPYVSPSVMVNDGDRDWWRQFLESRDNVDVVSGLILPAMAHSRPFRTLNSLDNGINSIDDTVLRSTPADSGVNRRGLFEARLSSDTAANLVDPLTRHRLLRKVANNSTNRSNVFTVFMTVRFFEAIQHPNGDVQIGGPLAGAAINRGFFVIDRTLPEKAFDARSGRFDYKKFVLHRKTLQ